MQYNHSIFKPIRTLFNTRTTHYSQGTKSTTRNQIKQQVYTKSRSQLTQKKMHIQSHYYVPNSRAKITSKLHKVLQEKVSQKHKKVTHNFEVNFSMNLHFTSKHQVSTIMSQKKKSHKS
jgi:hypothetical protein